jgi:NitT/TauT family transport system substrate-binding protein
MIFPALRCLAVVSTAFLFSACVEEPEPILRIGAYQRPGFEPLFLARSLGYLDEQRVQLVEFPTAAETLLAYRNHAIDVAAVTTDDVLRLAAEGQPVRIVLLMAYSSGADVVVARQDIEDIAGLKGRKVAVESNALGSYVLSRALETAKLGLADVQLVSERVDRMGMELASGQIDAGVTYDPHRTRLARRGIKTIFDSTKLPEDIADVLVAPERLVSKPTAGLHEATSGWFRALDYLATNGEDAAARMAPREGLTAPQFTEALTRVTFIGLSENQRQLGTPGSPLLGHMRRMMDFMTRAGMLPHEVDPDPLRTARLLPALQK